MDGRALLVEVGALRPRADQGVEVARLELVGVAGEGRRVGDAVVRGARREHVAERERAQRGVAAGRAAADREPGGVDVAARDQVSRRRLAVLAVDDAPAAAQEAAVGGAVARGPAVVHVDDREAARRPVLDGEPEPRVGAAGGPAVDERDQRRPLVLGGAERGVARCVVVGVHGASARARAGDRLGARYVRRVELRLRAPAQRLHVAGVGVDGDEGRAGFRAGGHAYQPAPRHGGEGAERRERRGDLAQPPRSHADHPQPGPVRVPVVRDDAARVEHRVAAHAEQPRRQAELGLRRQHRRQPLSVPPVEVPPPRDVGHAVQGAVRTPRGLEQGNLAAMAVRDAARRRQGAISGHLRDPELGGVPRHVRVVPADPREPAPVGAEARRGVEVEAAVNRRWLAPAAGHRHEQGLGLLARAAMVLGHADQPAPGVVHGRVGVADGDRRRDRSRRLGAVHRPAVQPLVGEVREVRHAVRHRQRPAAVLVDPGPGVVGGRRQLRHRAVRGQPHRRAPARLVRTRLDPVHVVAVDGDAFEPQRSRGQHLGGDRRLPRPVRRDGSLGAHGCLPGHRWSRIAASSGAHGTPDPANARHRDRASRNP